MRKKSTGINANDCTNYSRISINQFYTVQNKHMAVKNVEKTWKKPICDNVIWVYSTYNLMVKCFRYTKSLIQPGYTSGNRGMEDQE